MWERDEFFDYIASLIKNDKTCVDQQDKKDALEILKDLVYSKEIEW